MSKKKNIRESGGLVEFLKATNTSTWKKHHNSRTCYEAYCEIRKNLAPVVDEVERGAMASEIQSGLSEYLAEIKEIVDKKDDELNPKIDELISTDLVIYLNDHGRGHIDKVIERANMLVSCFSGIELSEFEAFILLCAIEIHDIGNILGRIGHERNLHKIFDEHCKDIIPDSPERRLIKSIAMTHGGKTIKGSKDTISELMYIEPIFDKEIRTRLLAAILRFADELADDSTRSSRGALDLKIIGLNSKIYQDYSRVLHTVRLEPLQDGSGYFIQLVYELEVSDLKVTYAYRQQSKYLLDEIYDRTLKMERERRYCSKFMHGSINIERIEVQINIYGSLSTKIDSISYTLEDISYPSEPANGSIKAIAGNKVKSGEEELQNLEERGEL